MKKEMVEMQQNAVQNQTAVMIEIGTNLLSRTAEQTRKLTDVEAQVSRGAGGPEWPRLTKPSTKPFPNATREKQGKLQKAEERMT